MDKSFQQMALDDDDLEPLWEELDGWDEYATQLMDCERRDKTGTEKGRSKTGTHPRKDACK